MQRTIVRGGVLLGLGFAVALATVRCADVNRGLGAACIRDSDCLSGLCEGQQCVALQTVFDGGNAVDAGFDAGSPGTDAATKKDTGAPPKPDAGKPLPDAHVAHDAGDAAKADASQDGAADGDAAKAPDATDHDAATLDAAHDAEHDDGHVSDDASGAAKDGARG